MDEITGREHDLPPLEGLWLGAHHKGNAAAVQKVQLPHSEIQWADNSKGPASLKVDNYAHGEDAALDSWVLLVPCKGDEASASDS